MVTNSIISTRWRGLNRSDGPRWCGRLCPGGAARREKHAAQYHTHCLRFPAHQTSFARPNIPELVNFGMFFACFSVSLASFFFFEPPSFQEPFLWQNPIKISNESNALPWPTIWRH
jgi:hypothetical protein